MATAIRVTRVANPRRTRTARPRRAGTTRNPGTRRKLTPKQIKFFGTRAQKAGLKRRRTAKASRSTRTAKRVARTRRTTARRKRNSTVVIIRGRKRTAGATASSPNPRRRRRVRRAVRRSANPALIVTLGNPHTKEKKMARKRSTRRRTTRARRRTRRANPVVVVRRRRRTRNSTAAPRRRRRRVARRSNPVTRTRRRSVRRRRVGSRRRNPMGGQLTNFATAGLGVTAGVFATKMIQRMIPANLIPSTGGFITAAAITGVSAYAAYLLAQKFARSYAPWVLAGGMAQTISVVINGVMPGFAIGGVPFGISGMRGMGELMPGRFTVPQNPVNTRLSGNGLARAYGAAY